MLARAGPNLGAMVLGISTCMMAMRCMTVKEETKQASRSTTTTHAYIPRQISIDSVAELTTLDHPPGTNLPYVYATRGTYELFIRVP